MSPFLPMFLPTTFRDHICVANWEQLLHIKDRHQWLGREFRGSLSLNMDKLFLKAIIYESYH